MRIGRDEYCPYHASLFRLMPGINLEDLQQGKVRSQPRNPVLATVSRVNQR